MATASTTLLPSSSQAPSIAALKASYQHFLYRRRRAWLQSRQCARIERELGAYTDRELSELNLRRSDIRSVAANAVRRA